MAHNTETILVVDDDPNILHVLELVLEPAGYHVLQAGDGQRGLESALAHEPDLILCDMHMPRMNGLAMVTRIWDAGCEIPVILMTEFGSERVAVEAFRRGVYNYLIKPFSIDDALQAVGHALRATRLAHEKERLNRSLLAAESVRRGVANLAHHMEDQLLAATGRLHDLEKFLGAALSADKYEEAGELIGSSQESMAQIAAVLGVLKQITALESANGHSQAQMLDFEQALEEELQRLTNSSSKRHLLEEIV